MYEIMSILTWHLQGEKILTESESKLYDICVCVCVCVIGTWRVGAGCCGAWDYGNQNAQVIWWALRQHRRSLFTDGQWRFYPPAKQAKVLLLFNGKRKREREENTAKLELLTHDIPPYVLQLTKRFANLFWTVYESIYSFLTYYIL